MEHAHANDGHRRGLFQHAEACLLTPFLFTHVVQKEAPARIIFPAVAVGRRRGGRGSGGGGGVAFWATSMQ